MLDDVRMAWLGFHEYSSDLSRSTTGVIIFIIPLLFLLPSGRCMRRRRFGGHGKDERLSVSLTGLDCGAAVVILSKTLPQLLETVK